MANTPHRTMRIPEDVWREAVTNAAADETSLTAVVTAYLRRYNTKHRLMRRRRG